MILFAFSSSSSNRFRLRSIRGSVLFLPPRYSFSWGHQTIKVSRSDGFGIQNALSGATVYLEADGTAIICAYQGNDVWKITVDGVEVYNQAGGVDEGDTIPLDWDYEEDDEVDVFAGSALITGAHGNALPNGASYVIAGKVNLQD